jgi:hypothetical protein
MKLARGLLQTIQLALAPIPKIHEGAQAVVTVIALAGIAFAPETAWNLLSISHRLAVGLGVLAILFFIAAFRLQMRSYTRPLTLEFNRFMSTINIWPYKEGENDFDDFKIGMKIQFRAVNNDTHPGCIKSMNMLLLKKRFILSPKNVYDQTGHFLLTQATDEKYIALVDGMAIPAKSPSQYLHMDRYFPIESLGRLLVNKKSYFFRLVMDAIGQEPLTVDIIPDWDTVPVRIEGHRGTLKDTVKEFRFKD